MQGVQAIPSLEADLEPIFALAGQPVATAADLVATLREIYAGLASFDLGRYPASEVRLHAPRMMQRAFEARLRLRESISDWTDRGLFVPPAVAALRDVFRISRYGLDMLGEARAGNAKLSAGERPRRAFTGANYNTFVNPRFATGGNLPFRSGDVLLVRGTAHNSAAIARIGDVDTQFSHLAIVHVDPAGVHWLVEALIEDGAVISPLSEALGHGAGRAVLYRHKNAELAARAARFIHGFVLETATGKRRHIPYDFSMRLKGRRSLFCSKLVRLAFEEASGGEVLIPAFKTRLDMRNSDFFRRIGVRAKETFAPGDIDIDPAFDLVAEWQDYRITSALRASDMMMDKVFEWMDTAGFRFRETFLVRIVSLFGRLSTRLSKGAKELIASVVPKIPANMRRQTIATIIMLHKTGEELMGPLRALEEDHIRMTGLPLPPDRILAHLDHLKDVSGGRIGYLEARA